MNSNAEEIEINDQIISTSIKNNKFENSSGFFKTVEKQNQKIDSIDFTIFELFLEVWLCLNLVIEHKLFL